MTFVHCAALYDAVGLGDRVGMLRPGYVADVVVL